MTEIESEGGEQERNWKQDKLLTPVDLKNQQLLTVFRDPVDGDYRLEQTLTSGEICAIAFPHLPIFIEN
ncbi:hypothetical protein ACE1CI_00095 [Aerosakkonemataceae cyanobacterium BLCC-F50]|uniref:Uncharacterized protein n=1 Tax=Floridaenema flaviceps BLCC-F50 TaxID=3153642 RepID=A0ABV4XHY9_9CYAN